MKLEEALIRCRRLGETLAPDIEDVVKKAAETDRDAFEAVVSRLDWRPWSLQKMQAFMDGLQSELKDKEAKNFASALRLFVD